MPLDMLGKNTENRQNFDGLTSLVTVTLVLEVYTKRRPCNTI